MAEFAALTPDQQQQLTQPFETFAAAIAQQKLIAVIRDTLRQFEETEYPQLLSRMTTWAQPAPAPAKDRETPDTTLPISYSGASASSTKITVTEPKIEYVSSKFVPVPFDKAWLADEADVDRYLAAMRAALLAEIQSGKRIQI